MDKEVTRRRILHHLNNENMTRNILLINCKKNNTFHVTIVNFILWYGFWLCLWVTELYVFCWWRYFDVGDVSTSGTINLHNAIPPRTWSSLLRKIGNVKTDLIIRITGTCGTFILQSPTSCSDVSRVLLWFQTTEISCSTVLQNVLNVYHLAPLGVYKVMFLKLLNS